MYEVTISLSDLKLKFANQSPPDNMNKIKSARNAMFPLSLFLNI